MPASLSRNNIFYIEPHQSIIAILSEYFDRGLSLKEIQYAIMEKHHLYHVDIETHKLLDNTIEKLVQSKRLKKYKMKKISKKKKKESTKAHDTRSNLSRILKELSGPRINAIYKDKETKRYKLRSEVYNELIRTRNIDALSSYPCEQVLLVPFDPQSEIQEIISWVIYGLPLNIFKKFTSEETQQVSTYLDQIEKNIEKIEEFRFNTVCRDWNNRVEKFLTKTECENIKKAFYENDENLWNCLRDALFYNIPKVDYKIVDKKERTASYVLGNVVDVSKIVFYRSMGWIFSVPGYEKSTIRPPFIETNSSVKLSQFMDDYYSYSECKTGKRISKMSKEEKKEYLKAWSEGVFSKDYNLSKNEVLMILEWCWNNRDILYDFWPYPISFSRHYDDDKALEKTRGRVNFLSLKYESNAHN